MYQLRGAGYEVSYVKDGLLALQRFVLERPDLVLLDVMMPQVSGWEVCRQIRACSSVPVIMLTAKNADPDVVIGLGAGADDYVTKPFSMVQLQARIKVVLRRAERTPHERGGVRPIPRLDPHLTAPAEVYSARAVALSPPAPAPADTAIARQAPIGGPTTPEQPSPPGEAPRRLGQRVREARQVRGLSLHQVERACKIRWEFLQAIEQENWAYVPRAQLQPALRTYTSYLGLDLRELLGRPAPARAQPFFPLHLAAFMAVVLVLLVVGLYLL
jgi:CheY-like chemotaxis protein